MGPVGSARLGTDLIWPMLADRLGFLSRLPRRDLRSAPVQPVEESLWRGEGTTPGSTRQPAGDGLWRYASDGNRAGHVKPVVVAGQFGKAEKAARRYGPAGPDGFDQRCSVVASSMGPVQSSLISPSLVQF